MAQINRITNGNVYLNGANQIGRCAQVDLPDVKSKETDYKAMGLIGDLSLPAGLDKLTAKIKMESFYPDIVAVVGNPNVGADVMIRANLETWLGETLAEQQPLVAHLGGRFTNFPMGSIKARDNADGYELNMSVTYAKLTLNGIPLYEVDIPNGVWKIDDVDIMAIFKLNIGA